jgi:hypothetical protein
MKNEDIVQIIYASRALFPLSNDPYLVEPEIAHILEKARSNNRSNRLVGVLCFGDGFFLQCLQGEVKKVNELLNIIKKDSRHTDIQILSKMSIDKKTFNRWSMKYAGVGSELRKLLATYDIKKFDPYTFNQSILEKVIDFLHTS